MMRDDTQPEHLWLGTTALDLARPVAAWLGQPGVAVACLDDRSRPYHLFELSGGETLLQQPGGARAAWSIVGGALSVAANSIVVFVRRPADSDCKPSAGTIRVCRVVSEAAAMLGCPLVDFVLVGGDQVVSMASMGVGISE